jgi:nucleoside-diphosphate-sugar epimerase
MTILVTGSDGFVGAALCKALAAEGPVIAATRVTLGDLGADAPPEELFRGIDAVVHLAARAHVMRDRADDPLAAFRRVNVEGTRRLIDAAARAGVRRLVYLSSVKVHGEASPGRAFTEDDPPRPGDAYAISKFEAESIVAAAGTRLQTVILRAPLVYGPGVRANFLQLIRLCDTAVPLPFGAVNNRRSLIFLGNLVDALQRAVAAPAAAGRIYLVRDAEDLSTPDLIRRIRRTLGRPAGLFPFPPVLLRAAAAVTGQRAAAERLLGTLTVDDGRIRRELSWQPPVGVDTGLAATMAWYRAQRAG